jgi:Ca2+-binding EF-hand superfamily protein
VKSHVLGAGLIALLAAWCAAAADDPKASRQTAPAQADSDAQTLVYLGDERPVLVRLHVRVNGKPLQTVWDDLIGEVFKDLDKDGDGFLDKDELERMPAAAALFGVVGPQLFAPGPRGGGQGRPTLANLDTDRDGKVSRAELADYYRKNGGAPFQVRFGADVNVQFRVGQFAPAPPASGEAVSEALFNLLDTNKDGKLSRAELAAAPGVLQKIDVNDDEMISVSEVLPNTGPPPGIFIAGQQPRQPATAKNTAFLHVVPGQGKELARRMLERYAPKGQETLTRKDVGLDAATFDRLDVNKDGKLDAEELADFAKQPADLELRADVGLQGHVTLLGGGTLREKANSKNGAVLFEMGISHLDVRAGELPPRVGPQANQGRTQILNQFKNADRSGKGFLTQKEAENFPFFRNSFKLLDLNGDGKLEEKELVAYLDKLEALQAKAKASCVSLTIDDKGRGLFDLIDVDGDGRLSVRELRNAVKLVDRLDRDGDGQISRDELPRRYQLTVRPGPASGNGSQFGVVLIARGGTDAPRPPEPKAGPLWFRKMDRNHDGDVSRREFLGTDEEFRKIDTDGDGLISLEEAERYDALMRGELRRQR